MSTIMAHYSRYFISAFPTNHLLRQEVRGDPTCGVIAEIKGIRSIGPLNFLSPHAVSLVFPISLIFSSEASSLIMVSPRPGSHILAFFVILTSKTSTPGPPGD